MQRRSVLKLGGLSALGTLMPAPPGFAQEPVRMRELYEKDGSFSQFALERDEKEVLISGFMAPPLKAESSFFVLTKIPLSVCPFCETEAEWPRDIVSIYTRDIINVTPFNVAINVSGILRLGTYKDQELGFVSRVRVTGAKFWRA